MRTEITATEGKSYTYQPSIDGDGTMRPWHRRIRGGLVVVVAAASLLAVASAGADFSQEDSASEDWSQQVDDNDLRAVGYVMSIGDHYFTLHLDGGGSEEFRFDSSRNPEIWDALKIGERVQVWYDPERQSRDEVGEAWYYWAHHFLFQESKEGSKAKQDDSAESDGHPDR